MSTPGLDTTRDGWLRGLRANDGSGAVVAYGGAGLSAGAGPLTEVELALLRGVREPGREPVICLVPTASGDDAAQIEHFREVVQQAGGEPHVLSLFHASGAPFSDILDRTDLVYVTGGAVANLTVLWQLHGLDEALLALRARGVPVAGSSAGALVWSTGGVTTSFGDPAGWDDGLAVLSQSLCPHFDTQPERAELFRALVDKGELPAGYGIDETAAAVFSGGQLVGVLSDDPAAGVHPVP